MVPMSLLPQVAASSGARKMLQWWVRFGTQLLGAPTAQVAFHKCCGVLGLLMEGPGSGRGGHSYLGSLWVGSGLLEGCLPVPGLPACLDAAPPGPPTPPAGAATRMAVGAAPSDQGDLVGQGQGDPG